ncbi:MAG TPA: zf-HC2 domain-containing protein [Terriglobales bacterium]|nr:zf-HC2 domain-containing protein [Terriglobales bacterium]
MDHSEAIQMQAAERYLLGELSAEQRDQFEEHFFGCMECASDIRNGAVLLDNARHVLTHEAAPMQTVLVPTTGTRGWLAWLRPAWGFAAAVVVLAGVLSYQNLVTIPSLKRSTSQPQTLASFSLVTAGSRSGGAAEILAPKDRPFGLYIDIPAKESFAYYTVDLQTESGQRPVRVQVSAEQAKDTVQILIPAGAIEPGNATLVVEGHAGQNPAATEIARYPLTIRFQ